MYLCNVQITQRDEQIDSLQQQIMGLERTRDRYVVLNPALREFSLRHPLANHSLYSLQTLLREDCIVPDCGADTSVNLQPSRGAGHSSAGSRVW